MPENDTKSVLTSTGKYAGAIGVCVAVALILILSGLLHVRVALTADTPGKVPLPVAVTTFTVQESYQRQVSYLGLVRAGRKANLAFEIPGRIAAMNVRQGSPVKAGDIIARLDDASLQASRRATAADLVQAQAELELAGLKAKRQRDLEATGAVSKEAFDETRLRARALEAQVESVSARLASIDIDLQKSQLVAQYDGIIADRYVYQGAVIGAGIPVVRLVEISAQEAHIGVATARLGELEQGSRYSLLLRDEQISAPLLSVRPDVDPVTRVATAVFALPEDTKALDGEPVYLKMQETEHLKGGWLPLSALLEGQRGVWTVLRLEATGTELRSIREVVEVIDLQGERAYVRGTLPPGSRVISSGVHRVVPGTLVTIAEQS